MLTKYDEFLCHQIVSTFDHPATSAREWTERVWVGAHDTSGKLYVVSGFARYPNRNIMDAYGSVTVEGKTQYVVRASRELRPEVDQVKVGPLSYEVIEGLRKIRFALGENEHGLSYQIEFEATMAPHEEVPQFHRSRGKVIEDMRRFLQVGRPSGWLKVEGKTYEVDKEKWRAERDHSWGIRLGGGGGSVTESGVQPEEVQPGVMYTLGCLQFEKFGVNYHIREDWEGKPYFFSGGVVYPYGSQKEELKLVSMEHDFQFRPDIRQINSGRVILHAVDGSKMEISIRTYNVFYLGPCGYYDYQGYVSGLWKGPYFIDGLKLDLSNPDVLREIAFLNEQAAEVRCGDDVGYGVIEMICGGKYPRYGFQGY